MSEISSGRIVKIRRNAERFWLRNVRVLDGKLIGQVDNHVTNQTFKFGDIIEISENEIIEEYKCPVTNIEDHMPHFVMWVVCLDCHKDYYMTIPEGFKTIHCEQCDGENIKGFYVPKNIEIEIYRNENNR